MKRERIIRHSFVEFVPDVLEEGILYISLPYATVSHKCYCGCGHEVVTPLSPTDWSLTFDGVSVSLNPSIGNWSFACKSHYWIRNGKVKWAHEWSEERIDFGRSLDRDRKDEYYGSRELADESKVSQDEDWLSRFLKRFSP